MAERKPKSYTERLEESRANRYKVIDERNLLLNVLIAQTGWEAHREAIAAARQDGMFVEVLCIHSPAGQIAYKLTLADVDMFDHLPKRKSDWDGHRRAQKLERLQSLSGRKEK